MSKLVLLNLGKGSLQDGCPFVTIQLILEQSAKRHLQPQSYAKVSQFQGSLPAAPEIFDLYRRWQLLYDLLYEARSINIGWRQQPWDDDIKIDEVDVTHVSDAEFSEVCQKLQNQMDNWLDSDDFRHIDRNLRAQLTPDDEIRVIIQTEDNLLKKLPWHIWRFFRDYPQAEVALSAIEFEPGIPTKNSDSQVRILAILGDSTGIDVDADRKLLSRLPNAKTVFLVEPKRQEIDELLWDSLGWDILFFAGHSSSTASLASHESNIGETGYIYINKTERLSIPQLRNALKKAIERGLQLAIFNSCDGLGLAQQLHQLQISQIIVMRQPVPDKVAQEFLKHFLKGFAQGQPFYLAVREAREKLQGLESDFPGASWLPVICQNPTQMSLSWTDLRDKIKGKHQLQSVPQQSFKLNFTKVLMMSFLVTSLLIGVRWLGILQAWELQAFDHLLQLRPPEKQDNRILIVTISEEDFQLKEQQNRMGSLSDLALAQLLEKLELYQPQAIGLDIYRNFPVNAKYPDLATRLQKSVSEAPPEEARFFAICEVSEVNEKSGIAPPPEIPVERQGFSDFVVDPDRILRRHLIAIEPSSTSPCTTPYALSTRLAFNYLQSKSISVSYTQQGDLQLGKVVFPQLRSHMGGYHNIDDRGYQILLNYRSSPSPREVAEQVSLKDVLTGKVNFNALKNRIILIGVTASGANDDFCTPYHSEMPGVFFHAQMVSQILSAVLDERPLLWVLPFWSEIFWVLSWSCIGGTIAWRCRQILPYGLAAGVVLLGLYSGSYYLLIQGCLIPLVPSALALVVTGASVKIIHNDYLLIHTGA